MKTLVIASMVLVVFSTAPNSFAATYPAKPIKLIVAFQAGGAPDIVARLVARKLSESLGQPVIVDNRPGAGGIIGAALAAKSAADGYTLFLGTTGTLASAPCLYSALDYDPVKSFAPISLLVKAPFLVLAHASVGATSLKDLIALAKSKPGQLNYGSAGNGGPTHIAAEMFKSAASVDLYHVPYKGATTALPDLLMGRIHLFFDVPAVWLPHVHSGKINALAVAGPKRIPQLPNVPTSAEAGLPGYQVSVWFGLVAPRGTPNEVLTLLNAETKKTLATKEIRTALSEQGFESSSSSPEEFATLISSDGDKWCRAVKASGATVD